MLKARSLRGQLQRYLLGGFVLVWAASAIFIHYAAQRFVTVGYDHSLFDTAIDLAAQIRDHQGHLALELTPALQEVLVQDGRDRVVYAVTTETGELLGGTAGLPHPPWLPNVGGGVHYYDAIWQAKPLRMAVAHLPVDGAEHRKVMVQVGETLHGRNNLDAHIQWSIAGLQLVQLLLIVFLVRHAVERGLRPLKHLTAALASRAPADSADLSEVGLVSEVRPLVTSMNALLVRLRSMLVGQRQFIADASHQLRTPLAGIQLQLDLALIETDPTRQQLALRQAQAATTRAAHLSHQLLTLSRAEPQTSPIEDECIDIARLADDVTAEFAAQALAAGVSVDLDLPPGPAPVRGDPVLLRELIANLLDNAIRYSGPNARVAVRVDAPDTGVVLEVADDGPGIAPDLRPKVFSRFYRIPGTPGVGCGLGLAIVAEIAERHAATVSLSTGPDERGTVVRVEFHAASETTSSVAITHEGTPPTAGGVIPGFAESR
jgi:two-component system sensor histidine kinase TctE